MRFEEAKIIYTIGHSTRSIEVFLQMLKSFEIETLVDIRSFPGSRKYPQFNQEQLQVSVKEEGLRYVHLKELGGRRKVKPDSKNTLWRNDSFRGYADYMETDDFKSGIFKLEAIALTSRTVYMCSEALWWRCHRSMVSDFLKTKGWVVYHIMGERKCEEHHYTSAARIANSEMRYREDEIFD